MKDNCHRIRLVFNSDRVGGVPTDIFIDDHGGKRKAKFLQGIIFAVALLFIGSTPVSAGIQGSKHDFSSAGWSGNKICEPCHTPHGVKTDSNGNPVAPLWNHAISTATYMLYDSPWLGGGYENAEPPVQPGPAGISRLCLSCHDGTIAIDAFGEAAGSITMAGSALIGTDLRDDHPVSIPWKHVTVDTDKLCTNCHWSMPLPFFGPSGDKRLECATCHDSHNSEPWPYMLRKPLAGSEICLFCHEK